VQKIIRFYLDMFVVLWMKLGYLLYLVDKLSEKLFDWLIDRRWLDLACFIRTYATNDSGIWIYAAVAAGVIAEELDEGENRTLYRCYFGLQLFARIFEIHLKRAVHWFLQPVFRTAVSGRAARK
jgi:hypothetical protein